MTARTKITGMGTQVKSEAAFATCAHEIYAVYNANKELHGPDSFVTEGPLLFQAYVNSFKKDSDKAEHNCRACAEFIERHGRLAFINDNGEVVPALWDHTRTSGIYRAPIKAMESIVRGSTIQSIAYFDAATLGRPMDGGFQHMSIQHNNKPRQVKKQGDQFGEMAIEREHFNNLSRSLASFNVTLVRRVLKFIQNESLKNGNLIENWAKWLERIYVSMARATVVKANRDNIIWKAVAEAPRGWCEVRGSAIGSLLKNLKEGMDDADAIALFDSSTRAEKYQIATTAPTEGNIDQAERLIAAMGLEPALHRRFAGLSDFPHIWTPKPTAPVSSGEGVFGDLRKQTKNKKQVNDEPGTAPTVMTWTKFAQKILPEALSISMLIPSGRQHFGGFLTAVNPDAPPLFKWDTDPENPNPVSSYAHTGGSTAQQWSLIPGYRVPVVAITVMPWMLNPTITHMGQGNLLVLEEAQDQDNQQLALFPPDLLSSLHEVRSTITTYSEAGKLQECPEDQLLAGYIMNQKTKANIELRVTTSLGVSDYKIDRWD